MSLFRKRSNPQSKVHRGGNLDAKAAVPKMAKAKPSAADRLRLRVGELVTGRKGEWVNICTREGFFLEVLVGDPVSKRFFKDGGFEPALTALAPKLVRPGGIFIDAGCNIGVFTCLIATQCPEVRIIALDANQKMVEVTRRNLIKNGRQGEVMHAALGESEGEIEFNAPIGQPSLGTVGQCSEKLLSQGLETVRVPMTTLNTILQRTGDGPVDLVKMDLEGFDMKVLASLSAESAGRIQNIVCEFNSTRLAQCDSSRAVLATVPWLGDFQIFAVDHYAVPLEYKKLEDFPEECESLWLRRKVRNS